jgi:hypothetical protein
MVNEKWQMENSQIAISHLPFFNQEGGYNYVAGRPR